MRVNLWIVSLLCLPVVAQASGGRSLPRGVEQPQVVQEVFDSPRGELQFTEEGGSHSAFLRNHKGALTGLREVRGPSACDEWLVSPKSEVPPMGCEFLFRDDLAGTYFSVRSDEMTAGSLFTAVRGNLRGKDPHVAF